MTDLPPRPSKRPKKLSPPSGDQATAILGWKLFLSQLYIGLPPLAGPDRLITIGSMKFSPRAAAARPGQTGIGVQVILQRLRNMVSSAQIERRVRHRVVE